jgi:hypothetical protein
MALIPSTNTLLRTVNLASAFCSLRPLTDIGGATNEPAFSIGDWTRNFILGPPFAWRWNRSVISFLTVVGQQDYQIQGTVTPAIKTFGWMEKASITDSTLNPIFIKELEVLLNLGESSVPEQPVQIAARLDDGAGNITFRLMPVPPKVYTVTVTFQNSSPTFQTINDSWAPIPDYLSYLTNQGFLAKSYEFINDERWGPAMQLFVRQVIAANNGLNDSQVNLFLSARLNSTREQQNELGNNQAARQGRGAF